MKFVKTIASVALGMGLLASPMAFAATTTLHLEGFEIGAASFVGAVQTPSGTGGITSAAGSFHGVVNVGDYTRFGGYNFGAGSVPTAFQEFWTSLDIYLDLNAGWANDTRFDYTSAASAATGGHLRDFVFSGGFYNDSTGLGAGTNRFIFNTSNNTPGWPKNPGRPAIAISASGWYTFEHHFYNNAGVLAVDLSILNSSDVVMGSWTLSNPADLISLVGGNRYGWMATLGGNQNLAVDNVELRVVAPAVPETGTTVLLLSGVFAGMIALRRRLGRN